MIKHGFSKGGFVLHKITSRESASRLSAWYDAKGDLLDVVAIDCKGHGYKAGKLDVEHCTRLGKIWAS